MLLFMKTKTTRGVKTQTKIYRHTVGLWQYKAFGDVTVDQITSDLEISRATFYHHYGSTLDIATEALNEFINCWRERPQAWYLLENDLPFHLHETISNCFQLFQSKGHLLRVGFESRLMCRDSSVRWSDFRKMVASVVGDNVVRQQDLGVIRKSLDPLMVGYAMFDLNVATFQENFQISLIPDSKDLASRVSQVWIPTLYLVDYKEVVKGV
jgi:AcrR family transcriptional regulator